MKTNSQIIPYLLLSFAVAAVFPAAPASAQTTPQSAAAVSQASPVPARITQAIDPATTTFVKMRIHPLARPEFDSGIVADSQLMNRMLLLLQRSADQETALRALLDAQQTKNSGSYHAWLTPSQFGQQFGVANADIQKITDWLAQQGFTGIKVSPGNMFVEFSGTAGLVRNAFHTEIHNLLVNGEAHMANMSLPQVPAALAPVISGIVGLHDFHKKSFMHYSKTAMLAKTAGKLKPGFTATPCGSIGSGTCYAVGPADFAKIYNLPSSLNGAGETIALVARSNITITDINQFGNGFGIANLVAFTAANNVIVNGPDPGIVPGDDGEATLDVEWSGAVAPGARILLVVNGGTQTGTLTDGVDLSAMYIVENNLAPIMSESFGSAEQDQVTAFDSALWEQAAAQGITVMVSTGDSGSAEVDGDNGNLEASNGPTISGTASTPFNVAVGGTDFNDGTNETTYWAASNSGTGLLSAISYIPETTWNDSCAAKATVGSLTTCTGVTPDSGGLDLTGGGGGQSSCGVQNLTTNTCTGYPKPIWQTGVGVPADKVRDIPDISFYAAVNSTNNNFYIVCEADSALQNGQACNLTGPPYSFSGVGGTSASSPAFAGIMALVEQSETAAGRLKPNEGEGNANYVLYKLAANQNGTPGTSACNAANGTSINAACTFNDITTGNNSVECVGGSTASCSVTTGNGVLVEPNSPTPFTTTTPAWSATAGYDLATGLGSVNVSNLVKNWGSAPRNFMNPTVSITSPAAGALNNVAHGTTENFSISVTSGSGNPTGDVSLIAEVSATQTISLGSATLNTSGTATVSTNLLPGGTYNVIAHYEGDGTFASRDSGPFAVTVNPENSVTSANLWTLDSSGNVISTNATTAAYGSPYILVVNVNNATNTPCDNSTNTAVTGVPLIPCPTGTIALTDNGKNLNDFLQTGAPNVNTSTVNVLGFVEDLLIQLPGGNNPIVANYSGDSSYKASASPTNTIVITSAATQISSVTANPSTGVNTNTPVMLVALIGTSSSGIGPTGTVTFSAGGNTLGISSVTGLAANSTSLASGNAILTHTFAAGTYAISATYSGDGNYAASGPTTGPTLTVAQATVGMFTMAAGPASVTTTAAASGASSGNSAITITPSGGFMTAVTVTCGSIPGVNCSALTIPAGTFTGSLTINVNNPSSSMTALVSPETNNLWAANDGQPSGRAGWWSLSAGTGLAAVLLVFLPGKKRYRAALGLGLACVLSFTLGCGGGSSGGGGGGGGGGPTPTVTQLTVSSTKVAVSPSATLTVSATVTGGTPTGTVQFMVDGAALGGPATLTNGSTGNITVMAAQAPAFLQLVGTHTVSANYSGGTTTAASQSGTLNVTITGTTSLAITGTAGTDSATSNVALTIN